MAARGRTHRVVARWLQGGGVGEQAGMLMLLARVAIGYQRWCCSGGRDGEDGSGESAGRGEDAGHRIDLMHRYHV